MVRKHVFYGLNLLEFVELFLAQIMVCRGKCCTCLSAVVGERALCAPVGLVGSAVPIFCIPPDVLTVPPVIEKDVKISITVFALSVSPSVLLTSLRASCCSVTRFAKLRHGCVFTRLLHC